MTLPRRASGRGRENSSRPSRSRIGHDVADVEPLENTSCAPISVVDFRTGARSARSPAGAAGSTPRSAPRAPGTGGRRSRRRGWRVAVRARGIRRLRPPKLVRGVRPCVQQLARDRADGQPRVKDVHQGRGDLPRRLPLPPPPRPPRSSPSSPPPHPVVHNRLCGTCRLHPYRSGCNSSS